MTLLWGKCSTDPFLAAEAILALMKHGKRNARRDEMAEVGALLIDEGIRHLRVISGADMNITMVNTSS